jgi:hypothetical protein
MTSSGTVPLKKIWAMLDECAPGWKKIERTHNWVVQYNQITFPRLPKGDHGARNNPDIQVGHVKQMVRLFQIVPCAQKKIPTLR